MCTRSLITLWHDDLGSKPVMGSTRSLLYMSIEFELPLRVLSNTTNLEIQENDKSAKMYISRHSTIYCFLKAL